MKVMAFYLLLLAARKPPWLSQNLTNQDVNSSSSLRLSCLAMGVPRPDIMWYKNGIPVKQGQGNLGIVILKIIMIISIAFILFFYFGYRWHNFAVTLQLFLVK